MSNGIIPGSSRPSGNAGDSVTVANSSGEMSTSPSRTGTDGVRELDKKPMLIQHAPFQMGGFQPSSLFTNTNDVPHTSDAGLMRLYKFFDRVSRIGRQEDPMNYIRQLISDFFTDTANFKISLWDQKTEHNKSFDIPVSALGRFFYIFFDAGAVSMTPILDNPVELALYSPPSKNAEGRHIHVGYALDCEDCTWSIKYREGIKVDIAGKMSANMYKCNIPIQTHEGGAMLMKEVLKLDSFEFIGTSHVEWISRTALVTETIDRLISPPPNPSSLPDPLIPLPSTTSDSNNPTPSPKPTNSKRRQSGSAAARKRSLALAEEERKMAEAQQAVAVAAAAAAAAAAIKTVKWESQRVPISPVGSFGIPEKSMRCLELIESVAQLAPLMCFGVANNLSPLESLRQYTEQYRQQRTEETGSKTVTAGGGTIEESNGAGAGAGQQTGNPNSSPSPANHQPSTPPGAGGNGGSSSTYTGLPPIVPPTTTTAESNDEPYIHAGSLYPEAQVKSEENSNNGTNPNHPGNPNGEGVGGGGGEGTNSLKRKASASDDGHD